MAVVEQEPANTSEISNFRYGRKAEIGVRSLNFCFWLQADQLAQPRFVRCGLKAEVREPPDAGRRRSPSGLKGNFVARPVCIRQRNLVPKFGQMASSGGASTELVRFLLRNPKHLVGIIRKFRLVA